ncbi:MAG TPA: signal peptidase I [Woeseiaceae bacterium]|nr:signal peptidase I [Woeseiaceae bacterium]
MQQVRPRKPIVALLMSAVLTGFGQLYNGEVNRAIWLFLALLFINVPWVAVLALYVSRGLLLPMLLLTFTSSIGIWIFSMVDAWRHAKSKPDYVPERWQTSGLYVLVFVVCNLVTLPALTIYVRARLVEPFRIPTASMEPSVLRGDFLFADKRYNCPGCKYRIQQGDIAVFAAPNDRTQLSIKRVIGLPGDRVGIEGRSVRVNGEPLSSGAPVQENGTMLVTESGSSGAEWTVQWNAAGYMGRDLELTVPPGQVFVLGDNRSNARDSRQFGTVSMEDVVGRARQVWFSLGPDGVRWGRIGQRVE